MQTHRLPAITSTPKHECDVRCGCGNLLARRIAGGIEIKCRRCKHVYVIELVGEEHEGWEAPD